MSEEATDKSASKPRMSRKKTQSQQRRYAGAPRYWEREPKEKREEQDYPPPFSATALNADSKGKSKDTSKSFGDLQCADCSKEHHITNCSLFAKKSVGDKLSIVKEKGLCFNCLLPTSPSHYSINCRRPGCPVERCKKKHHRLLHHKRFSPCKDSQKQETDKGWEDNEITSHAGIASGYLSTSIEDQVTLLPTGVVKLVTPNATLPVRVLVDSGSDQSYIRGEIVEALGLDSGGSAKTMMILMHGGQSRTRVKKANFQVSTRGRKTNVTIHAWAVPTICLPPKPAIIDLKRYPHLKGLALADTNPRSRATINILIGADQWSKIMKGRIRRGDSCSPIYGLELGFRLASLRPYWC